MAFCGNLLASGSEDAIRLSDYKARRLLRSIPINVASVAFSPDGKIVAAGSADGNVFLVDITGRQKPRSFRVDEKGQPLWQLAFVDGGKTLLANLPDGPLLCDAATGGNPRGLGITVPAYGPLALAADGQTLVIRENRRVIIWDLAGNPRRIRAHFLVENGPTLG